jgi:hypothetical protein
VGAESKRSATTLADLIRELDHLDEEWTIYAVPGSDWTPAALATACEPPDDEDDLSPGSLAPMRYFLEVEVATEVLRVWSKWRRNPTPAASEAWEALYYYATRDAYLPVDE